ncbi:hypothetical protein FC40_GL000261 [Ligilactobacillus hayakitensis DSM 18933 = JCM 14209]|uniref:YSIRK Gram-positive signal peptide domain-containing protein n=2 Tax=Ligilactobacillus TaxID=2767887 RepID=A0A0R1WPI6_9LACO|nr:hypothetical protein FC40_GL000261 [Ligilactobacillus hayakitensis DSM 18933 = JCM 14209]
MYRKKNKQNRYTIKKLNVGVASVIAGATIGIASLTVPQIDAFADDVNHEVSNQENNLQNSNQVVLGEKTDQAKSDPYADELKKYEEFNQKVEAGLQLIQYTKDEITGNGYYEKFIKQEYKPIYTNTSGGWTVANSSEQHQYVTSTVSNNDEDDTDNTVGYYNNDNNEQQNRPVTRDELQNVLGYIEKVKQSYYEYSWEADDLSDAEYRLKDVLQKSDVTEDDMKYADDEILSTLHFYGKSEAWNRLYENVNSAEEVRKNLIYRRSSKEMKDKFESAVDNAIRVIHSAELNEEHLIQVNQQLLDATSQLDGKLAHLKELKALYEEAKSLLKKPIVFNASDDVYEQFNSAYSTAKEIIKYTASNAMQETVDKATQRLRDAMGALDGKPTNHEISDYIVNVLVPTLKANNVSFSDSKINRIIAANNNANITQTDLDYEIKNFDEELDYVHFDPVDTLELQHILAIIPEIKVKSQQYKSWTTDQKDNLDEVVAQAEYLLEHHKYYFSNLLGDSEFVLKEVLSYRDDAEEKEKDLTKIKELLTQANELKSKPEFKVATSAVQNKLNDTLNKYQAFSHEMDKDFTQTELEMIVTDLQDVIDGVKENRIITYTYQEPKHYQVSDDDFKYTWKVEEHYDAPQVYKHGGWTVDNETTLKRLQRLKEKLATYHDKQLNQSEIDGIEYYLEKFGYKKRIVQYYGMRGPEWEDNSSSVATNISKESDNSSGDLLSPTMADLKKTAIIVETLINNSDNKKISDIAELKFAQEMIDSDNDNDYSKIAQEDEKLQYIVDSFENHPGLWHDLYTLVRENKIYQYESGYKYANATERKRYQDALVNGFKVLHDPNSTQQELQAAVTELQKAGEFKETSLDLTSLKKQLAEAKTHLNKIEYLNETSFDQRNFDTLISKAEQIIEKGSYTIKDYLLYLYESDDDISQQDVDELVEKLKTETDNLYGQPTNREVLSFAVEELLPIFKETPFYYNYYRVQDTDAAIKRLMEIYDKQDATQYEVDNAVLIFAGALELINTSSGQGIPVDLTDLYHMISVSSKIETLSPTYQKASEKQKQAFKKAVAETRDLLAKTTHISQDSEYEYLNKMHRPLLEMINAENSNGHQQFKDLYKQALDLKQSVKYKNATENLKVKFDEVMQLYEPVYFANTYSQTDYYYQTKQQEFEVMMAELQTAMDNLDGKDMQLAPTPVEVTPNPLTSKGDEVPTPILESHTEGESNSTPTPIEAQSTTSTKQEVSLTTNTVPTENVGKNPMKELTSVKSVPKQTLEAVQINGSREDSSDRVQVTIFDSNNSEKPIIVKDGENQSSVMKTAHVSRTLDNDLPISQAISFNQVEQKVQVILNEFESYEPTVVKADEVPVKPHKNGKNKTSTKNNKTHQIQSGNADVINEKSITALIVTVVACAFGIGLGVRKKK